MNTENNNPKLQSRPQEVQVGGPYIQTLTSVTGRGQDPKNRIDIDQNAFSSVSKWPITAHDGSLYTLERLKTVQPCSNFCATVQPFALPLGRRQAAFLGTFFLFGNQKRVETSGVGSNLLVFFGSNDR